MNKDQLPKLLPGGRRSGKTSNTERFIFDLAKLQEVCPVTMITRWIGKTQRVMLAEDYDTMCATMLRLAGEVEEIREQRDMTIDMLEGAALKHIQEKMKTPAGERGKR